MRDPLHVVVAADETQATNLHLARFAERLSAEGLGFRVSDDSAGLSADAEVYFPGARSDPATVLAALSAGVKVVQHAAEPESEDAFRDFIQGYVRNHEAEWFARLFPEPVHVADPTKLFLGLGATANPRAIILNAGIDGKGGLVSIGRASHLGADALLNLGPTDFTVGKFSMISANFSAHAMRHTMSRVSNCAITKGPFSFFGSGYDKAEPIRVGHDVWIGERVTCLLGVEFGNGCVVGAGSVVTTSLEPYGVYAGNPARLLRYRFEPEKIDFLNGLRWWDFAFDRLKEICDAFAGDITRVSLEELKRLF